MRRTTFTRACRAAFAAQAALCVAITIGAYRGSLPAWLAGFPHMDKIGHVVLGGLLAFFLDGALAYRPVHLRLGAWPRLAPSIVIAAAGVEELAQALSPRRTASLLDYAADVAGVCGMSWLSRRVYEGLERPREGSDGAA